MSQLYYIAVNIFSKFKKPRDINKKNPSFFFVQDFIYLFLEKAEGKEKERKRNINVWLPLTHPQLGTWPTTQACALTGN